MSRPIGIRKMNCPKCNKTSFVHPYAPSVEESVLLEVLSRTHNKRALIAAAVAQWDAQCEVTCKKLQEVAPEMAHMVPKLREEMRQSFQEWRA